MNIYPLFLFVGLFNCAAQCNNKLLSYKWTSYSGAYLSRRISLLLSTILVLFVFDESLPRKSASSVSTLRCFLRCFTSPGLMCMKICSSHSSFSSTSYSGFISLPRQQKSHLLYHYYAYYTLILRQFTFSSHFLINTLTTIKYKKYISITEMDNIF